MDRLVSAILDGDVAASVSGAARLREQGVSLEAIVTEHLEAAMATLDAKCTLEQFNLLEIMLVGRAVMEVMKSLFPSGTPVPARKATVVIATLEGDVHDLGKGILKMVLSGNGYGVVDGGRDCPLERLIDITEKESPLAIGISGLITPVIPEVRRIRGLLEERSLGRVRVMAGGAALKQSSREALAVDFVAESAFDGVRFLDRIAGADR